MAVLHMTSLLLKNSRFLLVFHSKLEEDFLYMAYADIMAKSCHDEEDDDGEEEVKSFEVTGSQRSKVKLYICVYLSGSEFWFLVTFTFVRPNILDSFVIKGLGDLFTSL